MPGTPNIPCWDKFELDKAQRSSSLIVFVVQYYIVRDFESDAEGYFNLTITLINISIKFWCEDLIKISG